MMDSPGARRCHEAAMFRGTDEEAWSSGRRWVVLGIFSLTSATNAFIFMDFATVASLSESVLLIDEEQLKWLYSGALIVVAVATPLAMYCVDICNWSASLAAVLLNVSAAWVRHRSVLHHSFDQAFASTILLGAGAAVVVSSYTVVPEAWFAPEERGLATSIAVQSNYAGWALGSFIPIVVQNPGAMVEFTRVQVVGTVVILVLFLVAYSTRGPVVERAAGLHATAGFADVDAKARRLGLGLGLGLGGTSAVFNAAPTPRPLAALPRKALWWLARGRQVERLPYSRASTACAAAPSGAPQPALVRAGARASAASMARNPRLLLHTAASALLGGVSFAIPAVVDIVLGQSCEASALSLPPEHTMVANAAFILSGVTAGLALGGWCRDLALYHAVVFGCSALCAVGLSLLLLLLSPPAVLCLGPEATFVLLVLGMAITGASSLGFIGLALHEAVELAKPASEVYAGGLLEWLLQICGAYLGIVSGCGAGFMPCLAAAWVATIVFGMLTATRGTAHRLSAARAHHPAQAPLLD